MKKIIIIALLGVASISAFAQTKPEKKNTLQQLKVAATDSLVMTKQQAIGLYKLLDYCKEAVSTTTSKNITVADAGTIMAGIVEIQKAIAEKYQPKQSDNTSASKPKE